MTPLDTLNEAERRSVAQLTDEVLPELSRWAAAYPLVSESESFRNRLVWLGMYTAIACPAASPQARFDLVALMMAIFVFDDVLDGAVGCSYEELHGLCVGCRQAFPSDNSPAVLEPPPRADLETVAMMLDDCARRFGLYPAPSWVRERLERGWERFVDASLQEARWRLGFDPWPSFDGYLTNAVDSVSAVAINAAYTATCDVPALGSDGLVLYDRTDGLVTEICRLCNDLGGVEREAREGALNAVSVLLRDGHDHGQVIATLQERITRKLEELDEAAHLLPEGLARVALYIRRTAHFAWGWYRAEDSRGLTYERLRLLLSPAVDDSAAPRPNPR